MSLSTQYKTEPMSLTPFSAYASHRTTDAGPFARIYAGQLLGKAVSVLVIPLREARCQYCHLIPDAATLQQRQNTISIDGAFVSATAQFIVFESRARGDLHDAIQVNLHEEARRNR